MLIAGVLCFCAAAAAAGSGAWSLTRPRTGDPATVLLRAVAPTQLAAAVMLAAGGVVALAARPQPGLFLVIVCVTGAIGTVAAGSWQGAKFAVGAQATAQQAGCAGTCATCTLSCH